MKNYDIQTYQLAKEFLLTVSPSDVNEKLLEYYLSAPNSADSDISINDLYLRMLVSAQNANMKAAVIGNSINGVERLSKVLFDFDVKKVLGHYKDDHIKILGDIEKKLKPVGKIRKTPSSIWPKYCRTIISAAEFLQQFQSGVEFFDWADHFYKDEKSFSALPLIISEEVFGIGFPLACDFLKELGFTNFGKPDVHIIEIFEALSLVDQNSSNYQILKSIIRIARNVGVTPYNVDKLFWLIGSGNFYDHPDIGNNGSVGGKKDEFISHYLQKAT